MYIERELEKKVRMYLKRKEIIAIVGTRQCGKTTLMKHIFKDLKNAKFISFDDREILDMFNGDIKLFIKNYVEKTEFLFIDEFQYAKEGGKQLKFIHDNYSVKIIISGSSVAELSVQSIKYLVGRIFVLTLSPLSFHEFLKFKNGAIYDVLKNKNLSDIVIKQILELYSEFIIFGGYPEVVLARQKEEKIEIIKNIYNTYLLREIREIMQISEDVKLTKLIKALALQIGNLINYQELSQITGFKYNELLKYIDILKKTFICLLSTPFYTNKRKELVKSPKLYFLDGGFRNVAINNFQGMEDRADFGSLNENFIATELFKRDISLRYWRTKAGAEVDFIIELKNRITPIEVKTNLNSPTYGKSFKNFLVEYKANAGYILSLKYQNEIKVEHAKVFFLPICKIGNIF